MNCNICHIKPMKARGMCNTCYGRWLLKTNPEFKKRQQKNCRSWHHENPDKANQNSRRYRRKNPLQQLINRLKKYDMTLDEFVELIHQQDGKCSICQIEFKNDSQKMNIDFNHQTGKIRGILCFRCNVGLSWFEEDQISKVINYLTEDKSNVHA